MSISKPIQEPPVTREQAQEANQHLREALDAQAGESLVSLEFLCGVKIHRSILEVAERAARLSSEGKIPLVVDNQSLFTTEEAAGFLGVSRPHLVELLEAGRIPFSKTSDHPTAHRRIAACELHAYQQRRQTTRVLMDKVTELDDELAG